MEKRTLSHPIMKAINSEFTPYRLGHSFYAPITLVEPRRAQQVDRSVFKKPAGEMEKLKDMKSTFEANAKARHGAGWKKLIGKEITPTKMQF